MHHIRPGRLGHVHLRHRRPGHFHHTLRPGMPNAALSPGWAAYKVNSVTAGPYRVTLKHKYNGNCYKLPTQTHVTAQIAQQDTYRKLQKIGSTTLRNHQT